MSGALKVARIVCERCEDKESDGCVNCIVRLAYDAEDDRLARIYRIECRETGRRFRARYEHKRCQDRRPPCEGVGRNRASDGKPVADRYSKEYEQKAYR